MIYICAYDDSTSAEVLMQFEKNLPIPPYDGPMEGIKWQKRRERILAWLLFQYAAGVEEVSSLDIQRTKYGKPYSAADDTLCFNISHCEKACACIISTVPCGIDVEKKFELRENLVRKICHPDEFDALNRSTMKARELQVRFLWSMKESFVKMDGRGLAYGINSVDLSALLPIKSGEIQVQDGISYFAEEFESYTLAGCVQGQIEIPIHIIAEAELMGKLLR